MTRGNPHSRRPARNLTPCLEVDAPWRGPVWYCEWLVERSVPPGGQLSKTRTGPPILSIDLATPFSLVKATVARARPRRGLVCVCFSCWFQSWINRSHVQVGHVVAVALMWHSRCAWQTRTRAQSMSWTPRTARRGHAGIDPLPGVSPSFRVTGGWRQ